MPKAIDKICLAIFGACMVFSAALLVIVLTVVARALLGPDFKSETLVGIVTTIVTATGIVFAVSQSNATSRRTESGRRLRYATERLERAYALFVSNMPIGGPPTGDPNIWHTVADLLHVGTDIGSSLSDTVDRQAFEADVAFWATRFREVLSTSPLPQNYFSQSPPSSGFFGKGRRIRGPAIVVIYRFAGLFKRTQPLRTHLSEQEFNGPYHPPSVLSGVWTYLRALRDRKEGDFDVW